MNSDNSDTKVLVKKALSDFLGIEPDDIEDDYSLTEDLHMKPTDLTDFMQILNRMNIRTDNLDFSEIETFSDLIESITQHE